MEVLVALKNIGTKVRRVPDARRMPGACRAYLRYRLLTRAPCGAGAHQLTDEEKAFLDSSQDIMAKFESADKAIGALGGRGCDECGRTVPPTF